jgi:MFS transporter, SP family, xylose:H+ symportor
VNMRYVWLVSLVAAMGGLLFGYDWVVIGGAKPFFEPYFRLESEALRGWANSCALLGCLGGAVVTGGLSDRFGRKRLLLLAALLFALSSGLTGWAGTFQSFVVWRILGGVAIGMASTLSPLYIAEIAPAHARGRLVALNQFTIVIGILAAQVVNWLIAEPMSDATTAEMIRASWNGQEGWRWMFTAVALPAAVFFGGSLAIPESPRWLVKNGRSEHARRVLAKIGGRAYAEGEVDNIQRTLAADEIGQVHFRDLLVPGIRRILLVGIVLAVLQQWSGINVIFNYAEEIFREAGYGVSAILFQIVITGIVNLVFTLVAMGTVDRFGRRRLMLIGCAGIALFHSLIGAAYFFHWTGPVVVTLVLATIACYAFSLAPVTWVLIAELFPNRIRGAAISVAVSALWIACFVLTYTFPALNSRLGASGTFWLYAAICAAGFVYIVARVPETKGKSLEEIEQQLST